jgi:hypothetical protein
MEKIKYIRIEGFEPDKKFMRKQYKVKTLFLLSLACAPHARAQSPNPTTSCQSEHWYEVLEKKQTAFSSTTNDSINIILATELPPLAWWQPPKTGTTPNRKFVYTRNFQYSRQYLVRIFNTSNKAVSIVKPDRQLMLGLQAQNLKGEWNDVEIFFTGICGRSFSPRFDEVLQAQSEWQTFTELLSGSQKTRYRLKLLIDNPNEAKPCRYFYSNEVAGTIDPCKFGPD